MPDIPFGLIIFILFFLLPALSNLLRRFGKGQGGGQKQEPRPGQPSHPAEADTSAAPTSGKPPSGTPDWLEEARRRVAEARRQEAEAQPSRPRQQASPRPAPSRPVAPRRSMKERPQPTPTRSLEGGSLEGQSVERQSLERGSLEHSSLEYSSLERSSLERSSLETLTPDLTQAPPLRTQRLASHKRATITKQELRFDAHDLAKGLIWHQVLSPPRSTLRRTRLSRRRP